MNAIGEILNRKTSVAQIMSKTVEGLNHAYELRDSSPEDLIFDLFKMPNKDEASISKLIKVSLHKEDRFYKTQRSSSWTLKVLRSCKFTPNTLKGSN